MSPVSAARQRRLAEADAQRNQEADDRASRILFSVKCLRPSDKYPYEVSVFETSLSVPVGSSDEVRNDALAAWYKMIEGGVAVSQALARDRA